MPVFWLISTREISALACFGSSIFIFINGMSSPVLFDFILSALSWVIYCVNELHHTQQISVFWYNFVLVPETLALETLLDRGCYSKIPRPECHLRFAMNLLYSS